MKFRVDGESYNFDEDRLLVSEARVIKKQAGMGLTEWSEGLQNGDPDAIVSMIYLAKKRSGEAVRWSDLDDINIAAIEMDDEDAESQGEDDPKPDSPPAEGEETPSGD